MCILSRSTVQSTGIGFKGRGLRLSIGLDVWKHKRPCCLMEPEMSQMQENMCLCISVAETCNRAPKSHPFWWSPWDLWGRKIWMGFNGEKVIISWSQSHGDHRKGRDFGTLYQMSRPSFLSWFNSTCDSEKETDLIGSGRAPGLRAFPGPQDAWWL